MNLVTVVKKEIRDSMRSYALLALTALFVVFAGGLAAIEWVPVPFRDSEVASSTLALLNSMRQPTVVLVPAIGIALGYNAIAGERDRGSIYFLLGLPVSRRSVVFGKFLGRTAVLAVAILIGYAVAGIFAFALYDRFDVTIFAAYTLLTLCYGATYVAIATGFSAGFRSRRRALACAVGLYTLFLLGWDLVLVLLQYAVVGSELPESGLPGWIVTFGALNPGHAFTYATRAVVPEYSAVTTVPESGAYAFADWMGFVVLACWIAVPLSIGYLRFRRAEI